MTTYISRSIEMPYMNETLVRERIHDLHREAEEQRLLLNVRRLHRAQREVERASSRLRTALMRLA